ncbi:hypothetical protein DXV76_10095 [Rhodobacteraceae bacterium CCMM004]|nr:hypothetical protein DXV76_10095 [Rhodobacteraceae bacterium CCMM004]
MSAPDTDIKKQERRHKGPLVGIAWAAGVAGVLLVLFLGWTALNGNEPGDGVPIEAESTTGG